MTIQKEKEKINHLPLHSQRKGVPNLCERLFYSWMLPIFWNGNQRDLEEYDLRPTQHSYDSKVVGEKLERNWLQAERELQFTGRKPKLWKVLTKTFFWSYWPGGIMQLISIILRTLSPWLFSKMLQYWSANSKMSRDEAMYYATTLIFANWIASYFHHQGFLLCQQFGMKIRVATSSLMFRKIMRMSNGSLGDTTTGKVVNMLSNDMQRFDLTFAFLHNVWLVPLQAIAVIYIGYMETGYAAFFAFGTMIIIVLPVQSFLGQMMGKVRLRCAEKTDERIKVMSEVISGIQVIKMYAWELPFQKVVRQKRAEELKEIRKATAFRTLFFGFMLFTDKLSLFFAVLAFVLLGNNFSANMIYPLHQLIEAVILNITLIFPNVLSFTAEMIVSLNRIEEFMHMEDRSDLSENVKNTSASKWSWNTSAHNDGYETDTVRPLSYRRNCEINLSYGAGNKVLTTQKQPFSNLKSISYMDSTAVVMHDVSASWVGDPNMTVLDNISARIRTGELCAIIGAVGSGKSSILQLLLKELPAVNGTVSINGNISYACQEAWLFPSTVRENIIFGLPFDPEKYKKVYKACALEKDFKQFPYGDQTLVGERGVSLSGGQRARINLARAVYRESDIYLLDDPLSAVDTNVGHQLFEGCINGYLLGKTRILVTHHIHFLRAADRIIVLKEGRIDSTGTYYELMATCNQFKMLLSSKQDDKDKDIESLPLKGKEKRSLASSRSVTNEGQTELPEFEAQTMAVEERASGNLSGEVIGSYFSSGGSNLFLLYTVSFIALTTAGVTSIDYWISFWANQMAMYEESLEGAELGTSLDTQVGPFTIAQYLSIYGGLVVGGILLVNFRVFSITQFCVSASRNLHNDMFGNIVGGVMRFFDTSSSGRILNRFTKDMGALDEILPRNLLDVLQIYGYLMAILFLNAIALYWTLAPSAVILALFYFMIRIYLKAAQSIKRLEGTSKSPVFSMVTTSLSGISTIRSAGAQNTLIDQFDAYQDLHNAAWNIFLAGGSAFGFWMDTVCLLYLTSIIVVFFFIDFGELIPVGSVGLAVTQSNTLISMLQHGARMLVEFLAQLTSVERILEYTKIETEENLSLGQVAIPPNWPSQGRIIFQKVTLRYSPTEEPVLKDLNIVIEGGWKVGIVGRTGAGKTSLVSAIFRFAYIDGVISIDGLDTSLLSRQGLRSKISIIPQEPVLFSATIRYNLDPFDIYSDDEIWRALEQVNLKSAVTSLDYKVTEGGANFSIGQRQLMCLARAVLRSNQILIMDEATANVDPQTDDFIQETIRRQFASCTVLTIAHRLNTIMDSDRVLVMNNGEVAEFDHPYLLLSDPNSHFSSMVRETGDKTSDMLFKIAKSAYHQGNLQEGTRRA